MRHVAHDLVMPHLATWWWNSHGPAHAFAAPRDDGEDGTFPSSDDAPFPLLGAAAAAASSPSAAPPPAAAAGALGAAMVALLLLLAACIVRRRGRFGSGARRASKYQSIQTAPPAVPSMVAKF